MSHVLRLGALGSCLEVRCVGDSADLLAASMREAWSRCLVGDDPSGGQAAPALEARLDDPAKLSHRLMLTTQEITHALIKAQLGRLLMLHAGAVSHPLTGQSLVYVAPGGTGKTTLTRLLGRRFGYLTDETVGIDETGAIHPYPKPLSVRRPEEPEVKDELSPDVLGLLPAPATPQVTRVVLLDRTSDRRLVEVQEVGFMDSLFALTEQTSSLRRLHRPLHRLADLIDAAGPVLRLRYTEAGAIEDELAALIGGRP